MKKILLLCVVWGLWLTGIILGYRDHSLLGTICFFLGLYFYMCTNYFHGMTIKEIIPALFYEKNHEVYNKHLFTWIGTILIGIPVHLTLSMWVDVIWYKRLVLAPGLWIIYYMFSLGCLSDYLEKMYLKVTKLRFYTLQFNRKSYRFNGKNKRCKPQETRKAGVLRI